MTMYDFSGMSGSPPTLSGLQEPDYPSVESVTQSPSLRTSPVASSLRQRSTIQNVPLPDALVEQFGHVQVNFWKDFLADIFAKNGLSVTHVAKFIAI